MNTKLLQTWAALALLLTASWGYADSHSSTTSVPGGIYVWELPEGVTKVRYKNKPVMLIEGAAFVGIPIKQKPGTTSLSYQIGNAQHEHTFTIVDKAYTEQHIKLTNKAMVNPSQASLERIRSESRRQGKLYNAYSEPIDLDNGFQLPLQGITTSLFGHRRFFNGQPRNPHSGLDIAADEGTPVLAAGNGVITLADDLYFNGNTIFVDHGQGLITMYCHLSKHLVAEGEAVTQGQHIGLVGATGRATGPHLHWSVSLNGTRVDPTSFMQVLNARTGANHPIAPATE